MIKKFEIVKALDDMAEIDEQLVRLEAEKQAKIDSVLTPEIRKAIQDIEEEFAPLISAASQNRSTYDKAAREGCLEIGESVSGTKTPGWQVVYNKGKKHWNMDKVMERIENDPTFKSLYEDGKPYTSMKQIKSKPQEKEEENG